MGWEELACHSFLWKVEGCAASGRLDLDWLGRSFGVGGEWEIAHDWGFHRTGLGLGSGFTS